MSELWKLTSGDLHERFTSGAASAVEIVESHLDRADQVEAKIDAILTLDRDHVLAQAKALDAKREKGEPLGMLAGIPIGIKDNICTEGIKTTAGSRILESFVPPYNAHVIDKILAADGIIFAKTNLDEFAMGSSCENSAFKVTKNPWDLTRVPGGSSGGSAAAVAAGIVPLALGTDTGGSIRQPASFCGLVGMKPTYGRVSRYGALAFASSLDQIGPISKDVAGSARLLSVIAGKDPNDGTSIDQEVPDYREALEEEMFGLTLGLPKEYMSDSLPSSIREAVDDVVLTLEALGTSVRAIDLPHTEYAVATYYVVANSEASSNLARYDGMHYGHRTKAPIKNLAESFSRTRSEGFGDEVKRRIMTGTHALSSGYYDAYYLKALKVRRKIREDFETAFEDVDAVIAPTSPVTAFKIGEKIDDPLSMYLTDILTVAVNLAGLPALSLPVGFSGEGLPIGLQIIGQPFEEELLLTLAQGYQVETDHHKKWPQIP